MAAKRKANGSETPRRSGARPRERAPIGLPNYEVGSGQALPGMPAPGQTISIDIRDLPRWKAANRARVIGYQLASYEHFGTARLMIAKTSLIVAPMEGGQHGSD